MPETYLEKLTPPKALSKQERAAVFEHIHRHLARHRNNADRWASAEAYSVSNDTKKEELYHEFINLITEWANALLKNAWMACEEPDSSKQPCPYRNGLN